jgi:hypothetical protein
MWTAEYEIETSATPEAIWRLWADVPHWPEWNADLAEAEVVGGFRPGGTIRMTSHDGGSIDALITQAVEPEAFVDEVELGDIRVRTTHRLERLDADRVRIVYGMEIDGPDAETLGPRISGDFPDVLRSLAGHAER